MTRVLIVDDEPAVRAALDRALRLDGYEITLAADGREALDSLADTRHDAVVLDVAMPGIDGLQVCRRLRDAGDRTPVLMLTARDAIDDRVAGLEGGADDYLVKPFAISELLARIRALVRRHEFRRSELLALAALRFDATARRAYIGERPVALSARECIVLQYLLLKTGQIVPREQFAALIPGWDAGTSDNALELLMSRLRAKIEPGGVRLRTVRGLGYLLEPATAV